MFALEIPLEYTEKSITCLLYVNSICNLVSGSRGRSLIKVYYLNFDIVLSLKAVLAGNNSRYQKKITKRGKKIIYHCLDHQGVRTGNNLLPCSALQ